MKIIDVDFKNKKKVFTFDDNTPSNRELVDQIDQNMRESLECMFQMNVDDYELEKWIAWAMGTIVSRLRDKQ